MHLKKKTWHGHGRINFNPSAGNYTAEHHKPLFWRRLATKLSPLVVPQLCPQLAFLNILSLDLLQDHE